MKVQATKSMTRAINDYLKSKGEKIVAVYETMSREAYKIKVDFGIWGNESDYLPASGEMRAIKIVYPSECCAMPQYLTSRELVKIFRKSDETFDGFMDGVLNAISI